ncbi:hypothetical protein [Nonomuraea ceibae]|uniref:hypothetical protein n=1 Tax=Nonomuraea ceibae TaxID=1935170 RepID=UPI001C5F01C2|nr:hypothetical protein [Nonomuraea ceibae]
MASEREPRRWRRRAWIALAATLAVLTGALGYGAWFGSDQAIKVQRWGPGDTTVLAARDGTVTLTDTPGARQPGIRWLEWGGAHTMLGDVVSRAPAG